MNDKIYRFLNKKSIDQYCFLFSYGLIDLQKFLIFGFYELLRILHFDELNLFFYEVFDHHLLGLVHLLKYIFFLLNFGIISTRIHILRLISCRRRKESEILEKSWKDRLNNIIYFKCGLLLFRKALQILII